MEGNDMNNHHTDPSPSTAEVGYLSIEELHVRYESGALSPTDVIATLTERIQQLNCNGDVNLLAVIEVDEEAKTRAVSSKKSDGPLWGVPVLVKDNIEVAGWASGAGSTVFFEPAATDAPLVTRLREAGAILLGNCNMTEWASASSGAVEEGYSARGGLTGNPWALDRSAGGSSSGSAASVAAGFAPVALGTETVGSLTQPASHCGVFAMKATRGLIPNDGIVPFSRSQDVPGVFARNLQDLSLMLSVMAGKEFEPSTNVRIGFLDDDDLNDPEQTPEAMRDAYEELRDQFSAYGSSPRIPRVPHDLYAKLFQLLDAELERDLSQYLETRSGSRWSSLQDAVNEGATLDFDPSTGELLSLPLDAFERALYADPIDIAPTRKKIERQFANILEPLFQDSDVIVAPAYSPAEKLDLKRGFRTRARTYMSYLDGLSSVVGFPSLTLPFTQVGKLPAGLVMVARSGGEASLLGAAATIDSAFSAPSWELQRRG